MTGHVHPSPRRPGMGSNVNHDIRMIGKVKLSDQKLFGKLLYLAAASRWTGPSSIKEEIDHGQLRAVMRLTGAPIILLLVVVVECSLVQELCVQRHASDFAIWLATVLCNVAQYAHWSAQVQFYSKVLKSYLTVPKHIPNHTWQCSSQLYLIPFSKTYLIVIPDLGFYYTFFRWASWLAVCFVTSSVIA